MGKDDQIQSCFLIIEKIKKFINDKMYKVTGKVPDEVDTRWFSHFNSLKFIISNASMIFKARNDKIKRLSDIKDSSSKRRTSLKY